MPVTVYPILCNWDYFMYHPTSDILCLGFEILQKDSSFKSFVKGVKVNALPQIKRWGLVSETGCEKPRVR